VLGTGGVVLTTPGHHWQVDSGTHKHVPQSTKELGQYGTAEGRLGADGVVVIVVIIDAVTVAVVVAAIIPVVVTSAFSAVAPACCGRLKTSTTNPKTKPIVLKNSGCCTG